MLYYIIGLIICLCSAWSLRRQQKAKRRTAGNIVVLLSLLLLTPYLLAAITNPLPMHALFVAFFTCPLLSLIPTLFYSRKRTGLWILSVLICAAGAVLFLAYLLYVQQTIWSMPYDATAPFWVEIWLPDFSNFSH